MSFSSDSPLSESERAVLSARADQFFDTLRREGNVPDFEPYLTGIPGPTRLAVLHELVIIDLGHRWGRGERPIVEDYVNRFPELGPTDQVSANLVLEEYRCRAKAGQTIDLSEYQRRFPKQFPTIRSQMGPQGTAGGGLGAAGRSSDAVVSVSQQYELMRELGRGMFGEVWLARKNPSGIEKAIKILLQPADREAAKREFRSLELIKNLRHPYLLATEDFWVADNRLYIVMELADFTLRGRLKQCKEEGLPGVPEDELFGYFQEAAEGLDYLHTKKITHRDVKPDNILVANRHAKVADFGLAREANVMQSMSFAGTPAYMAPEMWGGEGGPASDLYGLVVAYTELRQGRPPLQFGRGADVMFAHLDGQFDFADFIGDAEREVLRKGMSRMPEDRYPTCTAFIEDLGAAIGRSVVKKSGRVPMPGSRPSMSSPSRISGSVAMDTVARKPTGTVRTDSPLKQTVDADTRTDRATAADSRLRPARSGSKRGLLAAIAATAVLLGAIAVVIWMVIGPSGGSQSTGETPPTNPGGGGGGGGDIVPIGNGITTIGGAGGGGGPVVPPLNYPEGTEPEAGAKQIDLAGRGKYPEWVVAKRGEQQVRFRLITPSGASVLPDPFYIGESKVWNKLFREVRPEPELGGDDAPVVNVTANDAATFAAKLCPTGRLPTPDEWDHAAGLYRREGLIGPVLAGGEAGRVHIAQPVATHGPAAKRAANQFGLIDMATNGREWTRAVLPGRGEKFRIVEGTTFGPKDLVVLRGRNYTLRTALSYEMLEYEQKEPQTGYAGVPSPYTSFRVVLPLR